VSARVRRLGARPRVAAALVLAGLLSFEALPAQAASGSFTDREVVQLSHAGLVRGSGGLELHLTSRDDVQAANAAVATTTCDDCRATAVSFQVVVAGVPEPGRGRGGRARDDRCRQPGVCR